MVLHRECPRVLTFQNVWQELADCEEKLAAAMAAQAEHGQEGAEELARVRQALEAAEAEAMAAREEATSAREEARVEVEAGKAQSKEMLKKAVEAKKLLQGRLSELTAENDELKNLLAESRCGGGEVGKDGGSQTTGWINNLREKQLHSS